MIFVEPWKNFKKKKHTSQKLNEAILECFIEDSRPFDSRKSGIEKQFLIDRIMVGNVKITFMVGFRWVAVALRWVTLGLMWVSLS